MGVALRVLAVAALAYLVLVVAGWLLWGRR
jgi:hypothetical protein